MKHNITKKAPEISEVNSLKLELLSMKRNQALAAFQAIDSETANFALQLYKEAGFDPKEYQINFSTRKFVKIEKPTAKV